MCIDSVSARAAQLEDGWSPNELCEGEQSHAYIIKHPISTQLTPCDGIHSHQVQWHYYLYWFCECQRLENWGRMVSKWIVWGRAVSCLHNQAPNWNNNWLLVMEYTHISTVTLLRVLILWVPEQHKLGTDGLQMNCGEGEQSHAYIIKHPIETQLTPCDGIHWHQVQWTLLRVLILWVPEQHNWGTDGLQMNCVEGEQSHAYIISTQSQHNWLLAMEYTHNQVQWHYYVYWFCECQSSTTGRTDGLQMNCMRESSLMLT